MNQQAKEEGKTNAAAAGAAESGTLTIRWETANMRSSYANVVNVASTREEFTLLFGTNQAWHSGQKELVVELNERVILNPHAAKRLLILLTKVVEAYENSYGALTVEEERKAAGKKS